MNASDAQIRAAITQVAADWYAAHRAGPLAEADRAAFLAWLKSSPIHIEEYLGVAAMERTLRAASDDPALSVDALVEMARGDPTGGVVDLTGPQVRYEPVPVRPIRRYWRSLAATACVIMAGIVILWPMRDGQGVAAVKARVNTIGLADAGEEPLRLEQVLLRPGCLHHQGGHHAAKPRRPLVIEPVTRTSEETRTEGVARTGRIGHPAQLGRGHRDSRFGG